jgi:hypothetical protein
MCNSFSLEFSFAKTPTLSLLFLELPQDQERSISYNGIPCRDFAGDWRDMFPLVMRIVGIVLSFNHTQIP